MNTDSSVLTLCTLAWLAAAVPAQSPILEADPRGSTSGDRAPSALAGDLLIPIHGAADDEVGGSYGTWAAGNSYKVGFAGGMTFVPLLGAEADGQQVRWQTLSIRIGDEEFVQVAKPSGQRAADYRYEYDHGLVVEAYDVRAEGLEQTFVVIEKPAVRGDLVVLGSLHGSLHAAEQAPRHGALALLDERGRAVVGYGAATAVDAAGNTFPMTTAVREGQIQLRLPATSVASATFPLTVDPLLSNAILDSVVGIEGVQSFRDHEQQNKNLWVCYSFAASATDRDLVVRRFDDDYQSPGTTVFAELTDRWSSTEPAITGVGNNYDGSTITVFTREFSSSQRRVRWHRHRKSDLDLSTWVNSAPWQGAEQWRPVVGGVGSQAFGWQALVAFQEEPGSSFVNGPNSRIVALEVHLESGVITRVPDLVVAGDTDNERPSIYQLSEGGAGHSWVVAWQSFDNAAGGPWEIAVGRRQIDGFVNYATTLLPHRPGQHAVAPVIGGMFGKCVVAYGERPAQNDKPLDARARSIRTQRVDWLSNVPDPQFPYPARSLQSKASNVLEPGSCSFDYREKNHWGLTWLDRSPGNERLVAAKLGYEGAASEVHTVYSVPNRRPTRGSLCFDYHNESFTLMFGVENGTASAPLFGSRLTYQSVATTEEYGVGCSMASSWNYTGSQLIGSGAEWFRLQTPLANTGALLALAVGPAAVPLDAAGMPGCLLSVDTGPLLLGTIQTATDTNGEASMLLAVPSHLQPFDLHAQWFLLAPGANAAGVAASRGLKVPYVR